MVKVNFNGKEIDVEVCNSFFSKFRGLMFSKKKNLLFVNKKDGHYSVHMLFVFFPIDVVWLDKDFEVVDVRRNVKPFTPLVFPGGRNRYVLELSFKDFLDLKVGDKLEINGKIFKGKV